MKLLKMKKIILLIDQFGYTPQFIVKKENQYHSIFGGIRSLASSFFAFSQSTLPVLIGFS